MIGALKLTDDTNSYLSNDDKMERPSVARMNAIYLGGNPKSTADLMAVEEVQMVMPDIFKICEENRCFLRRSILYMLGQGIRQFIDIGSGIPTAINTHEIAQELDPAAKVAYVDVDEAVMEYGTEFLTSNRSTTIIRADIRHSRSIFNNQDLSRVIDLSKPVGILMMSVTCFLNDTEIEPVMSTIRSAIAEGSYIAVTHPTLDGHHEDKGNIGKVRKVYERAQMPLFFRKREEVSRIFNGFGRIHPGVVFVDEWHSNLHDSPPEAIKWLYGGLGKKASSLSMILIQLQQILDPDRLQETLANNSIASSMVFFVLSLFRFVIGFFLPGLE